MQSRGSKLDVNGVYFPHVLIVLDSCNTDRYAEVATFYGLDIELLMFDSLQSQYRETPENLPNVNKIHLEKIQ